eukprot:TRINITY_DN15351_c0_g1_i1.p3 TRINITY_DN15351_c0_g1~~TRINITY_DN15351_c0_g1_i1.p3  ORF type:complete len:230 (-),score=24.36 TRINITY_DN15351_c0_g1_i1:290-880(-)
MVQQYTEIASTLHPFVDVFLIETLSTIPEVLSALEATQFQRTINIDKQLPIWVSVTLQDYCQEVKLRDGTPLDQCISSVLQWVRHHEDVQLDAFLVNCCAPEVVTCAIKQIRQQLPGGMLYGGYANGFKKTTSEWLTDQPSDFQRTDDEYDENEVITCQAYARHVQQWINEGARIVGGCCGIGPSHIAHIKQSFAK